MDIKPISEVMNKPIGQIYMESLKKAYTHDWIFSAIYEKIIVFGSVVWSLYSIGKFLFNIVV